MIEGSGYLDSRDLGISGSQDLRISASGSQDLWIWIPLDLRI
jgi:hypothetical protein